MQKLRVQRWQKKGRAYLLNGYLHFGKPVVWQGKEKKLKSIQIYHLHLANGEIVQAAEDYKLKGKNTLVNLFQRANDEDIFFITDLLLGSCYIPKKKIVYISTGEVRVNAEPDRFETNICLLRRVRDCGSKD